MITQSLNMTKLDNSTSCFFLTSLLLLVSPSTWAASTTLAPKVKVGQTTSQLANFHNKTLPVNKSSREEANQTLISTKAIKQVVGQTKEREKGWFRRQAQRPTGQHEYRLPSWFNYALYKRFYGKHYSGQRENEIRKRIYLRTALKVFQQRALYRAGRASSLWSVNELSDLVSEVLPDSINQ